MIGRCCLFRGGYRWHRPYFLGKVSIMTNVREAKAKLVAKREARAEAEKKVKAEQEARCAADGKMRVDKISVEVIVEPVEPTSNNWDFSDKLRIDIEDWLEDYTIEKGLKPESIQIDVS